MSKREKLRELNSKKKITILERNIYILSSLLLLSTIIINILNIIYYPILINGVILEVNILIICFCIYSIILKQNQIFTLENKKNNLKLKYFPEK